MSDEPRKTTEEIAEEARQKLDSIQDDFDERLGELEKRATASKAKHERSKARVEAARASDRESAKGLGVGLSIAYVIIGMPLAGFGLGFLIDRQLGTTGWQGGLGLTASFIGVGYAAWMLQKTSSS